MKIKEIFHIVFINMIENKFRLMLTSLGIIVGTVTIVLVLAIGQGGEKQAAEQFSNLSADTIYINLNYSALGLDVDFSSIEQLTPESIDQIMEETTTLSDMYLRVNTFKEISYKQTKENTNIIAVTQGYAEISSLIIKNGTDFSGDDFLDGEHVAVIGAKIAEKLFVGVDPVGNYIKIGDYRYKIIGVLKRSEDGLQGANPDDSIYIPYNAAAQDELIDEYTIPQAVGKVNDIKDIPLSMKEIQRTLNYYLDNSTVYTIEDAGSRIEAATASATTMKMLLISVAIIVFIVGGIGIMNVLFVTVKERTKEIGILKALGAKENDILMQFLLESFSIGVFSGVCGIFFSVIAIKLMSLTEIPVYPTIDGKIIAFLFAVVTSTVFGFYPAYKASKLLPIQALSEE